MSRIRAVFLDFYNTVARFDPPREQTQVRACAALGLTVSEAAVRRAYPVADDFLSREGERLPLAQRSPEEQADLWSRYEQTLLARAGIQVDKETAARAFRLVREDRQGLALFEDVLPALQVLQARGYRMGLLSNMDDDLDRIVGELGLGGYLDFTVTSRQVGAAKPHPPLFLEALRRVSARPEEAVHVGDQYHGDVMGARGVGIRPVLLDREGFQDDLEECPIIRSLAELPDLLTAMDKAGGGS
ncbi:MAG: HAD family hydrolase [Chloroflexi bacterium]|nr:HAD family hydrolase [Chloroflexota bacterium]